MFKLEKKIMFTIGVFITLIAIYIVDPESGSYPVWNIYVIGLGSSVFIACLDVLCLKVINKMSEKNGDVLVSLLCGIHLTSLLFSWYKIWFYGSILTSIILIALCLVTLYLITRVSFTYYKQSSWKYLANNAEERAEMDRNNGKKSSS